MFSYQSLHLRDSSSTYTWGRYKAMAIFQEDPLESCYSSKQDSTANCSIQKGFDSQKAFTTVERDCPHSLKRTSASYDQPLDRRRLIWHIKNASTGKKVDEITSLRADDESIRGHHEVSDIFVSKEEQDKVMTSGMDIQRPKSALHSGDFHEKRNSSKDKPVISLSRSHNMFTPLSVSPPALQHHNSPETFPEPWQAKSSLSERQWAYPATDCDRDQRRKSASFHLSQTSKFLYKSPTSPLAQSSRPDTPEDLSQKQSRSPEGLRRHTFSPPLLQHFHTTLGISESQSPNVTTTTHSQRAFPWQAHQPRRSLNIHENASSTFLSSRRISLSDSPLHHAPMVGSYEESILRGRMSTTPSAPLDFVAQIGVLGKGKCKPSLRCPPHATIPFPAVFYSYESGGNNSLIGKQPSPYVGLIDIENGIPPAAGKTDRILKGTVRSRETYGSIHQDDRISVAINSEGKPRPQLQTRVQTSFVKAPQGGSYRIPEEGQLQIIIKNPNKTAIKLFLIPYDVTDMKPGQKTFIRQRSYSAGPLIDMPLSARRNLGTDRPEAALNSSDDPQERPMLRYLIHLHICCPSEGRFYLYRTIRVVFANRVLDGKEKLRNEVQFPEPRYSVYKPIKNDVALVRPMATDDLLQREAEILPESNTNFVGQKRNVAKSLPFTGLKPCFASFSHKLPFENSQEKNHTDEYRQETRAMQKATSPEEHWSELYSSLSDDSTYSHAVYFGKSQRRCSRNESQHESLISQQFKDMVTSSQQSPNVHQRPNHAEN